MSLPILYSFRRCPYAMRARLALSYSEIEIEHRDILLKDKPQEMLDASPKGTVPVLVLPTGKVIDESLDIMHWALNINDPNQWLSWHSRTLIEYNDAKFKMALDRYKYPNRYPDEDGSNAKENCLLFLEMLEENLSKHAYLSGDQITLTDMAIFPFIRQFSKVEEEQFNALPYIKTIKWLNAHLESPLFQKIMKKRPIWSKDEL